ncbi:MAG: LysM peptidoglycan-binding domain-containing protein [Acidimicrobiales bacterium]|nr:LysM peptidoglycan-binding domain-containing protein [Acidimicrobiales bacterium]
MVAITTPNPVRLPARQSSTAPRALHVVDDSTPEQRRPLRTFASFVAVVVMVLAVTYLFTSTPTTPGATGTPATLGAHVVSEGETLWSIAQEIAPAGEAATYVERLADSNGGATVVVGQRLTIPVP